MSKYRVVKGKVPGNFNVERLSDEEFAAWAVVGFALESQEEAMKYILHLKDKEATTTWNIGEVVWEDK